NYLAYAFTGSHCTGRDVEIQFDKINQTILDGNTIVISDYNHFVQQSDHYDKFSAALYNPKQRVNAEKDFERDRLHDPELIQYMDSLLIGKLHQDEVLTLVKQFDYLKAGLKIASFVQDTINFVPHVDAIRRIYGEDRIFK